MFSSFFVFLCLLYHQLNYFSNIITYLVLNLFIEFIDREVDVDNEVGVDSDDSQMTLLDNFSSGMSRTYINFIQM